MVTFCDALLFRLWSPGETVSVDGRVVLWLVMSGLRGGTIYKFSKGKENLIKFNTNVCYK